MQIGMYVSWLGDQDTGGGPTSVARAFRGALFVVRFSLDVTFASDAGKQLDERASPVFRGTALLYVSTRVSHR